jgi:hypothetical protein
MRRRALAVISLLLLSGGAAAAIDAMPPATAQLVLMRTARTIPATGDPVWQLQLRLPGERPRSFEALVGRAGRQEADRHRLGSQAPLPPGRYTVSGILPVEPDDPPELGRLIWIGLEPQFPTERAGLGIHHDPSAGLGRESGTDGCIGVIRGDDLLTLAALLEHSGTRELVVSQ